MIHIEICRGCNGGCSYCVIKKAKGALRSRKIKDILEDIKKLYDPEKELSLIADDCGCYGEDINSNLPELIEEIHRNFPKLTININYLNPLYLEKYSDKFIKLFSKVKFGRLQVPLQSGSDKIIKIMNREYDTNKIISIVNHIRKISPNTLLCSHFIVGFPGETGRDFLRTLSVSKHFDFPVAFEYSDIEGTLSSTLPNKKLKFVTSTRTFIAIMYFNIVIFFRLLTNIKTAEKIKTDLNIFFIYI